MCDSWQKVLRDGIFPQFTDATLAALRLAVATDDCRLIQGATTTPPPLACLQDWPVEGADLIGLAGMFSGLKTVGEVEELFARVCFEADQRLGHPAAVRWWLEYHDDTPWDALRAAVGFELDAELTRRAAQRDTAA
jgi:hypothetical protein